MGQRLRYCNKKFPRSQWTSSAQKGYRWRGLKIFCLQERGFWRRSLGSPSKIWCQALCDTELRFFFIDPNGSKTNLQKVQRRIQFMTSTPSCAKQNWQPSERKPLEIVIQTGRPLVRISYRTVRYCGYGFQVSSTLKTALECQIIEEISTQICSHLKDRNIKI